MLMGGEGDILFRIFLFVATFFLYTIQYSMYYLYNYVSIDIKIIYLLRETFKTISNKIYYY
jgi:hypothetical protein